VIIPSTFRSGTLILHPAAREHPRTKYGALYGFLPKRWGQGREEGTVNSRAGLSSGASTREKHYVALPRGKCDCRGAATTHCTMFQTCSESSRLPKEVA